MPWSALPESHGAALKEQILALSSDKRNFVVDPPEGTDFVFNMDTSLNLAMALLKADPNLEKTRFNLVPKVVKEPVFWRNYFYRVSLLSQSAALEQSRELESSGPTGTNVTVAPTSKFDDSLPRAVDLKGAAYTEEQHGSTQDSAHASGKPTEAVLHEELADGDEFATESYSGDWEKELQEELSDEQ
ncbi:hypothetical protein DFJ73DRAFT_847250 [Zopfochytrium polystomum]|nr:hypothetical protein DFJ73DRAFT_847250 [Zopfochytrium polystomum]